MGPLAPVACWAPADKHGFGTARQLQSPVWFTLRQASLSEVYYPDLDTPSLRGLQFAVTDVPPGDPSGPSQARSRRAFVDRETVDDDPRHVEPVAPGVRARVEPVPGSLTFRQVVESPRWKLTKTWFTDPARTSVLADVRFESKTGRPLRLYVLADPAASDTGDDDRGRGMVAWDASSASAVAARPALRDASSGYRGESSDPWIDLQDHALSRSTADAPGNVVQGALTRLDGVRKDHMTLAIGFGRDPQAAVSTARASLHSRDAAHDYAAGWRSYLASLKRPPASVGRGVRLYQQSLMVLAASEDKRNRGATVAAPNMPWVWGTLTLEKPADGRSGPYHLVWPRDFYHVVTAQKAAGDGDAATRQLDYLWRIQKPDGSWWQNTRPDGKPHWTSLQLDEVALPVVLAWWLGRTGAGDWPHIERAADFILANGPRTQQERWENQDGYSPNTIATEIAGLVCAAAVARANGDDAKSAAYLVKADEWQKTVEALTATTNGPYSPKPYYLRVTKDGNPNAGTTYGLGDNFPRPVDQREIVDNSFLGLVLFGAKKWNDPAILNSLAVGDSQLRADTPNGPVWHRFTFDGYGETDDGGDWDLFPTAAGQTHGRAWPLLTGERGEYELLAGRRADGYLATMARTANDGLMLPEQVFEDTGEGTRSATPLAWTHAQYVRLAWSIQAGAPVERPSIVAERYAK
ncbi:glycoside hydrolase family 15 protein [Candidatus Solirubrobacter pratensis]|uniref:glycoside hydrolase family 15 protein n=1 Tax=Candidatus Solirubrobacter pratensis TaxID=1298857 RepID=UPI0009DB9454|nr:glycoside hydrolase family 15 protein [Candidatus Solirubrobacter pratensis]